MMETGVSSGYFRNIGYDYGTMEAMTESCQIHASPLGTASGQLISKKVPNKLSVIVDECADFSPNWLDNAPNPSNMYNSLEKKFSPNPRISSLNASLFPPDNRPVSMFSKNCEVLSKITKTQHDPINALTREFTTIIRGSDCYARYINGYEYED